MSAFTTVVGRLGELSESELRQLHSIVGIRLGITEGGGRTRRGAGRSSNKAAKGSGEKVSSGPSASKASSKGNPSRKSQWETHPLYKEYRRLKQVVETQAREAKTSFASVDTPEKAAYRTALSQWLEAKSSFRDRRGPEKESAEESSAKGKAPAATQPATGNAGQVASGGNASGTSWADEVQDAMDVESDGDEQCLSSDEDVQPTAPSAVGTGPKRDSRNASISTRGTPPKRGTSGR